MKTQSHPIPSAPNTGHTPGPWIAFESKQDKGTIYIQKQINEDRVFPAWAIAQIPSYQANDPANARLIAAAPDLLAALEAAVNQIESLHTDNGWSKSGPRKADLSAVTLRVCRAAIARATGQGEGAA
jgi:hypothetical protein